MEKKRSVEKRVAERARLSDKGAWGAEVISPEEAIKAQAEIPRGGQGGLSSMKANMVKGKGKYWIKAACWLFNLCLDMEDEPDDWAWELLSPKDKRGKKTITKTTAR